MDQKIDINSGDWKQKNECIYYSQEKRAWYCIKCDEIIKSPRTANTHAGYHVLVLPSSRKKSVSPKNQLVKEELSEQARRSIEEYEQTIASPTRKEKTYNPPQKKYPQNWNTTYKPKEKEPSLFTKKLLLLMKYRQAGATDEEMHQLKIDLGFVEPPDPEELQEKEESTQILLNLAACDPSPRIREQILRYLILRMNDFKPI